ncbi:ATP-binding protein [Candidatus Margulisiibacteriota bacterium]
MTWYSWTSLALAVWTTFLAIFVFFKNRTSLINITFSLLSLSIVFWAIEDFVQSTQLAIYFKDNIVKLGHFGGILAGPFALHFIMVLTDNVQKRLMYFLYGVALLLELALLFTNYLVKKVLLLSIDKEWRLVIEAGFLYQVFIVFLLASILYGCLILIKSYKTAGVKHKKQIKSVLLAACVAASSTVFYFPALLGINIPRLDNLLMGACFTIISYSIVKHQLIDIEVIIKRSFIFTLLVAIISLTYTGSVIVFGEILQRYFGHGRTWAAVFTGVLITIGFQPLKKWLQRTTDRFLFQKRYNYQSTLQHLSKTLNTTIMLERILKLLMAAFLDTIRVEKACIVFQDRKTGQFVYRWGDYKEGIDSEEEKMVKSSPLIAWFRSFRISINVEDLESTVDECLSKQNRKKANGKNGSKRIIEGLKKDIAKLDAQMIVPIYYMDKLTGFFALGKKMSGYNFSNMDRELLEMIAYQAGTAMENARLYAEERRRVNELTLLNTASWSINSAVMSGAFYETILNIIRDSLHVDRVMLALLEEGDGLKIAAVSASDVSLADIENTSTSLDDGIWREFFKQAQPMIIPPEEFDKLGLTEDEMSRFKLETEVMLIPLIFHTKIQGFLAVDNKESRRHLSRLNKDLISSIASQIALALENARLNKDAIEAQKQAAQSERLAALGTMVAGFAHEIKNPMVALKTFTDILPTKYEDENFRRRYMEIVPEEVKRVNDLVEEMLSLARKKKQLFEPVDMLEVISEVAGLCEHSFQENDVSFVPMIKNWPKISGANNQIKQVFLNLFHNAAQAMPKGGELIVSGEVNDDTNRLHIRVSDTGIGISEERIAHVFEPFYTTRHEGTGLGLAITHKLIEDHDGTISVESKINQGTTFTVTFPVTEETEKSKL